MTLDISKLNNIKLIPSYNRKKEAKNSGNESVSFSGLAGSTPDYNVKVPMQYSKIGVTTLDNGLELHEYKMANGQKVVIMPSDSPTVQLQTYVNTGSMNEKDDVRGISHFIEHMMFNGTRGDDGYKKINSGETFKLIEEMGGYANAHTNYNVTSYEINLPMFNNYDFGKAVEIQAAMINNPAFTDEMIEKEKGPVCSEINMYSDMPEREILSTSIKNLLNVKTTSAEMIGGTVENIQNLTREKLLDYYNTNYCPSNMTTVITGNIIPDEAMLVVSKHFRNNNVPKTQQLHEQFNPIDKTVRKDVFSPKATKTTGVLSFVGPKSNDLKETVACDAVRELLSGTGSAGLNYPLKNLNTDLFIEMEYLSNTNDKKAINSICYSTAEGNSEKSLKLIFDKLNNFATPTQKEMDRLKLILKKNFEDAFESSQISNELIGMVVNGDELSQLSDYKKVVDSLTAEDLVNAAKKYFDTSKTSIAIVHPSNVTQEQLTNNYQQAQMISFRGHRNNESINNENRNSISFKSNIAGFQPSGINNREILNPARKTEYILQNNTNIGLYDSPRNNCRLEYSIICDAPANVKPGVTDILDEMLSRGSAYRDMKQFEDAKSDNCASVNAGCNRSSISASVSFIPEKAGESLDLMKENILAPRFTYEDFEAAKQKVREVCQSTEDTSFEYLKREMFKNQHYGENKDDVLANLDNVTLNDVMGLYQYYLQNGKAVAAVTAPFSQKPELKDIVFNRMSGCPVVKQNKYSLFENYIPVENSKVFQKESNKSQADVSMGFKYKLPDNLKDEVTLKILTYTLCSSNEIGLFNTLREKEKLAYSVSADNIAYDNNGMFLCNILTTTVDDLTQKPSYENVQKSIDGFKRQINLLREGQFSDEDFQKIKNGLKAILIRNSETTKDKTWILLNELKSKEGLNRKNQELNMIDSITKQDVINMANYVFAGNPTYSVIANKATLDANSQYLKNLEK